MPYIILGLIIFVIIVIVTRIKIVPQAQVYIVERLGTFTHSGQPVRIFSYRSLTGFPKRFP